MTDISILNLHDYTYTLPADKIASYPLPKRELSKLLVYDKGTLKDDLFYNIEHLLKPNSLLIFNKTKVVHARLIFQKETGSTIEVFCLEPVLPTTEISQALIQTQKVTWKCFIGGAKKWKDGKLLKRINGVELTVQKNKTLDDAFLIEFEWNDTLLTFGEILQLFGNVPLPPYIKRTAESIDDSRYQTVYAHDSGSVAAPTAGLHFTSEIIQQIENNTKDNFKTDYITLHVSAGTFKPISADIASHIMHTEHITVNLKTLQNIISYISSGTVIAVGTTSMRTLESLYWIGINLMNKTENPFHVAQYRPYEAPSLIEAVEALKTIEKHIKDRNAGCINASTSLMIVPGYQFRIVKELITNFHQPNSTLLLLVSAFIGNDWKIAYQHALDNNYRFLSYGDACFFKH